MCRYYTHSNFVSTIIIITRLILYIKVRFSIHKTKYNIFKFQFKNIINVTIINRIIYI